jgi:Flp pilus assembly pilin Flp
LVGYHVLAAQVTVAIIAKKAEVSAMLQGKFRNILVALLLLTYVGQGLVAASTPCNSMVMKAVQFDQAATASGCAGHSDPSSIDSGTSTNAPDGCPHCNCYFGGCTAIALATVSQTVAQARLSVLVDGHVTSASIHFPVSLFRPPIAV